MRKNKSKGPKEPTLLRKIIEIHHEQALHRKAMRNMVKLEWSFDFLALMLIKAGKLVNDNIQLEIENSSGHKLRMTYSQAIKSDVVNIDDDILNNLDNTAAVESFIRNNGRR